MADTATPGFQIGGASNQQLAQTITVDSSGTLVEIRLPITCTAGTLNIEVRGVVDGIPDQTIKASQSASADSLSFDSSLQIIALPGRPTFYSGDRFALVLSASDTCDVSAKPLGDSYPLGEGYFRNGDPDQAEWLPLGEGEDLPFEAVIVDRAEKVVAGVNFDGEGRDGKADEEPEGGYVRVSCFLSALYW